MTPEYYGKKPSDPQKKRWESGSQLRRWRLERGLSAKRLAELVEVTERSIHRAERGRKVGARIKVAMKLLASRIASGEVVIIGEKRVLERMRRSQGHDLILREPTAKYGSEWHGKLRTGADIRAWRKSVGLYVKELAALLGVVGPSVMRAERSESPSSRIVYGVELLRAKVLSGELDLRVITQDRVRRGRPKKE
jgi:transcriptional regulator with XRE-family HTH domain